MPIIQVMGSTNPPRLGNQGLEIQMDKQALIARAEALIAKAVTGGQHVGATYDVTTIPATIAAGLPTQVNINGQTIRITAAAAEVLAGGAVVKSMPLTDTLRDSLLVSHAVAVARG